MKIKILGTRGEVDNLTPYHSKHSGILLDKKILFDIGEKDFLKYKPKYIFITHLHPDHAFFVAEADKVKTKTGEIKIPVYSPEKYKNAIDVKALPFGTTTINSYYITAIPTHHSKKVKSVAYLIKKGGRKFLYTGDLVWVDKKYHYLFNDLDLVITEASYIRKGGLVIKDKKTAKIYGHTGVPNLINLFKNFTKQIIFIHFGKWFFKDIKKAKKELHRLGCQYKIKVYVGYDGMEIDLNKL